MAPTSAERLDSWKQIAGYLGREVRTVIRWEKERNLPVHRVPGGKRRAVFAYSKELDAWLAGNRAAEAEVRAVRDVARTTPTGAATWALGVGVLLLLVAGVAVLLPYSARKELQDQNLAAVTLQGDELLAFNQQGGVSWGLNLPAPAWNLVASQIIPPKLDPGIGERVLVSLRPDTQALTNSSDEVEAFSAGGKPVWDLVPDDKVNFGRLTVGPPWEFQAWSVVKTKKGLLLAVALRHSGQWESMVLLADQRGRIAGRFVNAGPITTLRAAGSPAHPLLLVGGANHFTGKAALAVVDVNHFTGRSPDVPGTIATCQDCSTDRPLRYFVFPRSELNRVAGTAPSLVRTIEAGKNGIVVHTTEMVSFGQVAEAVYKLSPDLELQSASFNDTYWALHRQLQLAGRIHHSREYCPDRFGPAAVRVWEAQAGWTQLRAHRLSAAAF